MKRVARVAHDSVKKELLERAASKCASLARNDLYATATTGALVERELGLDIARLNSGPLAGDFRSIP